MTHEGSSPQSALPSVDRLLRRPEAEALASAHGRAAATDAVRAVLAEARQAIGAGAAAVAEDALMARAAALLDEAARPGPRPVFNLTGTVLHTNLGRAVLPETAIAAVAAAARGASDLEFDVEKGGRGDRDDHVAADLCRLTGAEAATVVNNNAAAVLLVLNTLAIRKEVLVSRGELIEIGGAFRIPEIMTRAGCRLREVGTTNRTHLADFEQALGVRSAMLLKVHTSNYAIQGFTASVPEKELAALARNRGVPFVVDLGSGTLVDLGRYGLPKEPTPQETLAAGADLVTFSGDKLLGGPQAGLIVGRAGLVKKIKRNHLKRALRVDKMTLAALEAVLRLYRLPEKLVERLPTLRLLARPVAEIEALTWRLEPALAQAVGSFATVSSVSCHSQIGSGALPVELLPSRALALTPPHRGRGAGTALKLLAAAFRALPVPVIGTISGGALCFDLRCLEDEYEFVAQLSQLRLGETK
jgi:L-seryl-tRNA(Ser) seleniumtransferase